MATKLTMAEHDRAMAAWARSIAPLQTGTAVKVIDSGASGRVIGHTTVYNGIEMPRDLHIVELEHGFWSEDGGLFISLLVAHRDNLQEVAA